jgi:transposase
MTVPADSLPDDPDTLKAMLLAERTRAERLEQIIKEMQRHRFGRRAETLPEDQLLLGFEEVEQTAAGEEADLEAKSPAEREGPCLEAPGEPWLAAEPPAACRDDGRRRHV